MLAPPRCLEDVSILVGTDHEDSNSGEEFSADTNTTQLSTQPALNDLISDLVLPKELIELLVSRVKGKGCWHQVHHSRGTGTERKI